MSSSAHVKIGGLKIGGGAPIRVESMLKTPLEDTKGCLHELERLRKERCELVRVAFPDDALRSSLRDLVSSSPIPIMADIHFNHRYALAAIDCGCGSIRINPGNMTDRDGLRAVLAEAGGNDVVIRIGANGGSLSNAQISAAGGDRSVALVAAVEEQLQLLLDNGFANIILSAKSSSVMETVRANHILSQRHPFPLHVGVTEAGPGVACVIKSASGVALLLGQGIGDTMRVSLTGDSVEEVRIAYGIQRALDLRQCGYELISCPGCGRRQLDVAALVERVQALLPNDVPDGCKIAVMGCEVNGPKEAAAADLGLAGTPSGFVMFRKGEVIATAAADELDKALASLLKF